MSRNAPAADGMAVTTAGETGARIGLTTTAVRMDRRSRTFTPSLS